MHTIKFIIKPKYFNNKLYTIYLYMYRVLYYIVSCIKIIYAKYDQL